VRTSSTHGKRENVRTKEEKNLAAKKCSLKPDWLEKEGRMP